VLLGWAHKAITSMILPATPDPFDILRASVAIFIKLRRLLVFLRVKCMANPQLMLLCHAVHEVTVCHPGS
jgi:hypothetical protein